MSWLDLDCKAGTVESITRKEIPAIVRLSPFHE
jgi:hypothetical protein